VIAVPRQEPVVDVGDRLRTGLDDDGVDDPLLGPVRAVDAEGDDEGSAAVGRATDAAQ
jgi:hypothetical protein